ncbi:MAG: ATP-dependent zinc protease [Hormoscilla sp. GM7CHS1pb]|nr:ATP-dependent zinc protease [Hormoscilla sp. GM7CHS1pb]
MGNKQPKDLPVIGWREWISLPDMGITTIKAKIDTGARSSALHAFDVHKFNRDGKPMVRFKVHPFQRDSHSTIAAEAELFNERYVRNSGGDAELRPAILTAVEILGSRSLIELTLTNRDAMGFRMLLGRQAVRRRFLVDPGRSYLLNPKSSRTKPKRQKSQTG